VVWFGLYFEYIIFFLECFRKFFEHNTSKRKPMWLEIVKHKWKPTAKLSASITISYIKPSIKIVFTAYQLRHLNKRRPAKL